MPWATAILCTVAGAIVENERDLSRAYIPYTGNVPPLLRPGKACGARWEPVPPLLAGNYLGVRATTGFALVLSTAKTRARLLSHQARDSHSFELGCVVDGHDALQA